MLIERTFIRSIFTLSFNIFNNKRYFVRKKTKMSKIYKVIFNKNDVYVESKNKTKNKLLIQYIKTTNKNKSEMNVIADDVLDCLSKAKELFFKQYNQYAKSIEVVRNANTSLNMINDNNMKVSA